ncbi:Tho complex subunit 7-domain-containing protein [Phlebopus sp. FC_14]|nr:Tho complex subunit 7-domain-containing protein [Phlebopus sp. FC_14]
MSNPNLTAELEAVTLPPPTIEEEDAIIHTRITNDERPLRRIVRKFYNYASLAHTPFVQPSHGGNVDDAREAFLIELAAFELALKKSLMVCEAESRQVEEYQRERRRIGEGLFLSSSTGLTAISEREHDSLRNQLGELKVALEHAQMERKRKIEYDSIAEKINTFPSRDELQQSILALENDMTAIRAEHDTQERIIRAQKSALDGIVVDLSTLRLLGKDKESTASRLASPLPTPAPDSADAHGGNRTLSPRDDGKPTEGVESGEVADEKEEGEDDDSIDVPLSTKISTIAKEGASRQSATPLSSQTQTRSERMFRLRIEDDDIEMGEVAEDPKHLKMKRKIREELEEGEASDSSSALSDPPDD